MNVELPLILVIAVFGYFGIRLFRPPTWLIVVLLLGGFLLADTFLAPAIESGTRTGVDVVNETQK
ncbi:hypothetical protein ACWGJT_34855 [Streptomyces xantholiticus]|jgi:hypothetical protein|uniref:Uncharacterized protein n=3 Tax=Streptomyces TaxID=1883 RepID=A0ABV1UN75_9ACTN|nr:MULTISPECIES: hypothetical protein [Streptomyces]NWF27506.1 hypothetical protein [Streptomyces sp. PKU-EA00015]QIP86686.1 hypothetical protein GLX30_24695 [Streptomyces sp. Tu 2975]UYQ61895.1 hypothetical protein OGH68_10590 [Streptomyces peucetius]GGW73470.1 hypothetical protein GCM10010381_67820 [Streptomyces xantholiticus]